MNTARGSSALPEDVLVIHYADLSPDALTRLQTAAAIGKLLEATDESYRLSELSASLTSIRALRAWLDGEQPNQFWKVDGDLVVVVHTCGKHVLVGTSLLLEDLDSVIRMPCPPRMEDIDLVWQAARYSIEQNSTE